MWGVYLALFVLAVVRAAKLQYCQELILKGSALRKDVATVVFTMDGTCVSCYREIQKLARLRKQMARLGHNADVIVALDQLPSHHEHKLPSEVTVNLEDAWAKLGQLNGHIFVFDRCGRLAYQVITPWSRQMYPFTAMAGLSALYDAPCGECNATSQVIAELQNELMLDGSDQGRRNQSEAVLGDFDELELQGNKLPLTIAIRERHEHIHNGNRILYDTIELKTNDPNYHGHGTDNPSQPETSEPINDTSAQMNETTTDDPRHSVQDEKRSRNSTTEEANVSSTTETRKEPPADQEDYRDLLKRYQPLMRWRTCANLIMSIQV